MTQPITAYVSILRVRFNECDPFGHVNNSVYLNYMEQMAIDHAESRGWGSESLTSLAGALFVARKHEITYLRPAFDRDWLLLRTWPGELGAARFVRHYTVSHFHGDPDAFRSRELPYDELPDIEKLDLVVSAATEWAFMNVTTGRPARIPEVVARGFVER